MIKSFRCDETEKIINGTESTDLPHDIQSRARRKLKMIHNAREIRDLRSPPSNRLEKLKGDRKGEYSIRINDQWRICFEWKAGHAWNVEIVDYHG